MKKKIFISLFDKNCSSSLKPVNKNIENYLFNKKFGDKKIVKLKYITLNSTLKKHKLSYIDWFKTGYTRNRPKNIQKFKSKYKKKY